MPSPPSPPMTLGNMRELGVRSLAVTCELCNHEGHALMAEPTRCSCGLTADIFDHKYKVI